jgi:hypothetical protein
MKIRNGFVSNSSSSSFIIIVKEEDHLKALEEIKDDYHKAIIEAVMLKNKCFGMDVRVEHLAWNDNGDHPYEYLEIEFNGEAPHRFSVSRSDVIWYYQKILEKNGAKTFTSSRDF